MLDGTDVVRVVEAAGARPDVTGAGPEAEAELGVDDFGELGDGSDWGLEHGQNDTSVRALTVRVELRGQGLAAGTLGRLQDELLLVAV